MGPKTAEERVAPASLSSLTAAVPVGQPLYGAMAFDACSAPSVTSMQAWRQSPYVAVGIYTSGSMRACPFQGGTSWINQVTAQGWGLIPIHVGPLAVTGWLGPTVTACSGPTGDAPGRL